MRYLISKKQRDRQSSRVTKRRQAVALHSGSAYNHQRNSFVFKGTSQRVNPHFVSSKFLLRVRREDSSFALARLD